MIDACHTFLWYIVYTGHTQHAIMHNALVQNAYYEYITCSLFTCVVNVTCYTLFVVHCLSTTHTYAVIIVDLLWLFTHRHTLFVVTSTLLMKGH